MKTMSPSAGTSHHSTVDMKIVAVVISWLLIITCIASSTDATVDRHCPSKGGVAWYWNEIESRCEACSVSVCTYSRLPEACRRFCENGQSASGFSIPGWAILVIIMCVLTVLVTLVMVLKKYIPKSRIRECFQKQSLPTITVNTSEGPIASTASGQLQPIRTPFSVRHEPINPQPENRPIQATGDKKTEETWAKTPLSEEETRSQGVPRQTVSSSCPSEGAPGGKYRLLPQNDPSEVNV